MPITMEQSSRPVHRDRALAPQHLVIRGCEARDMEAVTAIYGHHVLHSPATFELDPPSLDEMLQRRRAIVDNDYPYLLAERAGHILGYTYAGPYRPRPAYRATIENSIYIRPGFERQGIGRALMRMLLAECERRNFRQVIAVIGDSANLASIKLHEEAGFRLAGTLQSVGFKFGRWLDSVLMQRDLGAGDRDAP
jgi:phosphinothricin acetyltransferase